jgi:hypothetical protein
MQMGSVGSSSSIASLQAPVGVTDMLHSQGSQAPLEDFDQLVEGPWPIPTNCPQRSLRGQAECNLAGDLVEKPPVSGPNFRSAGRRPFQSFHNFGPKAVNFDPSTSLRAVSTVQAAWHNTHSKEACSTSAPASVLHQHCFLTIEGLQQQSLLTCSSLGYCTAGRPWWRCLCGGTHSSADNRKPHPQQHSCS